MAIGLFLPLEINMLLWNQPVQEVGALNSLRRWRMSTRVAILDGVLHVLVSKTWDALIWPDSAAREKQRAYPKDRGPLLLLHCKVDRQACTQRPHKTLVVAAVSRFCREGQGTSSCVIISTRSTIFNLSPELDQLSPHRKQRTTNTCRARDCTRAGAWGLSIVCGVHSVDTVLGSKIYQRGDATRQVWIPTYVRKL